MTETEYPFAAVEEGDWEEAVSVFARDLNVLDKTNIVDKNFQDVIADTKQLGRINNLESEHARKPGQLPKEGKRFRNFDHAFIVAMHALFKKKEMDVPEIIDTLSKKTYEEFETADFDVTKNFKIFGAQVLPNGTKAPTRIYSRVSFADEEFLNEKNQLIDNYEFSWMNILYADTIYQNSEPKNIYFCILDDGNKVLGTFRECVLRYHKIEKDSMTDKQVEENLINLLNRLTDFQIILKTPQKQDKLEVASLYYQDNKRYFLQSISNGVFVREYTAQIPDTKSDDTATDKTEDQQDFTYHAVVGKFDYYPIAELALPELAQLNLDQIQLSQLPEEGEDFDESYFATIGIADTAEVITDKTQIDFDTTSTGASGLSFSDDNEKHMSESEELSDEQTDDPTPVSTPSVSETVSKTDRKTTISNLERAQTLKEFVGELGNKKGLRFESILYQTDKPFWAPIKKTMIDKVKEAEDITELTDAEGQILRDIVVARQNSYYLENLKNIDLVQNTPEFLKTALSSYDDSKREILKEISKTVRGQENIKDVKGYQDYLIGEIGEIARGIARRQEDQSQIDLETVVMDHAQSLRMQIYPVYQKEYVPPDPLDDDTIKTSLENWNENLINALNSEVSEYVGILKDLLSKPYKKYENLFKNQLEKEIVDVIKEEIKRNYLAYRNEVENYLKEKIIPKFEAKNKEIEATQKRKKAQKRLNIDATTPIELLDINDVPVVSFRSVERETTEVVAVRMPTTTYVRDNNYIHYYGVFGEYTRQVAWVNGDPKLSKRGIMLGGGKYQIQVALHQKTVDFGAHEIPGKAIEQDKDRIQLSVKMDESRITELAVTRRK